MGDKLSPFSGVISCAECGANYVFALEHKKTKSKSGVAVNAWYSLLIHSKNKKCSNPLKRIDVSKIREIVKKAYPKTPTKGLPGVVTMPKKASDEKYRKEMIVWTGQIMVAMRLMRDELKKRESDFEEFEHQFDEVILDLKILLDIYAHPERSQTVPASGWKGIYDYVDAIEKATLSSRFFVDKMRRPHTKYIFRLKFHGAKRKSIPVTKKMLLLKSRKES